MSRVMDLVPVGCMPMLVYSYKVFNWAHSEASSETSLTLYGAYSVIGGRRDVQYLQQKCFLFLVKEFLES